MKKIFILIVIFLVGCSSPSASDENKAKIKAVYDAWESGTKEEWMSAYLDILADDFYRWNGRYVGLGFRINTEEMTVIEATASPAKDHFMPGDKFISVNGMEATTENADDLPFRGALGGEVVVVLERDGSEQTVTMIKKYHAAHDDDVEVMIIPDIESVNYGRGVGYEINEYQPPADSGAMFISATKIRESIKNGDDTWKSMVDESLHTDIEAFLS